MKVKARKVITVLYTVVLRAAGHVTSVQFSPAQGKQSVLGGVLVVCVGADTPPVIREREWGGGGRQGGGEGRRGRGGATGGGGGSDRIETEYMRTSGLA